MPVLTTAKNWRDWTCICLELIHQYSQWSKSRRTGDPCEHLVLEI